MRTFKNIQDLDLRGRRVFMRVDFNVPLQKSEVSDSARIEAALPSIKYVMEQGGKCILASHLGRPDGKPNPKYSLEPVAQKLSAFLQKDVILTDDCVGDGARGLSHQMRAGDVMLLENLRFHAGEEENSTEFANRLLELCEVYVSDAFGTLHRAHASTSALPKLTAQKGIGFLVQKELSYLAPLREAPVRPFVLIMGGAKVSDKIGVIEAFLSKVDGVIIGGAMAYAFLKAMGVPIGKSLCDDKQVSIASRLLKSVDARKIKFLLPEDHLITQKIDDTKGAKYTTGMEIPDNWLGVDIGPKSLARFETLIASAEMIFWNGPMGVFETPEFAKGTFDLAKAVAASKAKKLAGGGDSAAAISESGLADKFDFVSTGGGATLEYLEGKDLPGLKALDIGARA